MKIVDLQVRREQPPPEFHCYKNNSLRRFDLTRTDRPNYHWFFTSKEEALAHARKHVSEGALFCTVDDYGCVESALTL